MGSSGNVILRRLLATFVVLSILILIHLQAVSISVESSRPTKDYMVSVIVEARSENIPALKSLIESLGGEIRFTYKYVNAFSASIPLSSLPKLEENPLTIRIYKDYTMKLMDSIAPALSASDLDSLVKEVHVFRDKYVATPVKPVETRDLKPNTYWNPVMVNAVSVWDMGYTGLNSTVAIIDSGVWSGHFMLYYARFIGGVDLSFDNKSVCDMYGYTPSWYGDPKYLGWDNPNNYWHGSHVSGIVAGAGAILVPENATIAKAIELYSGIKLPSGEIYGYPGYKIIYLLGVAPSSSLYIVKAFDHTGAGVPTSLIMMAIEHVIDLKVSGVDIDVISMSLGGPTLYDGRDPMDKLIDYASSLGITVVAAAGNSGPASMTISSPGTSNTAITVAAAADPVHTRVFWDYYYDYLGLGYYLYRSDEIQIIYFSSRGPTSDGRLKPTVSATGVFVLSAYPTGGVQQLAFASGTSMSTPAVSGVIALLNDYSETVNGVDTASPEDYRQAIVAGAKPISGYGLNDQGAGYVDAYASLQALMADKSLGDSTPSLPEEAELADIRNTPIAGRGYYEAMIDALKPGRKVEFIFKATEITGRIILQILNVELGDNPLEINSFEVYIQGAKRTIDDYFIDSANVNGNAWFKITDDYTRWGGRAYGVYSLSHVIEPGYWRIIIENDWTSYDNLSGRIRLLVDMLPKTELYYNITGEISQGAGTGWIKIPVPPNTANIELRLCWRGDWSRYPSSDLDLYVYWDEGLTLTGATLNSPERVVLKNPTYIYVYIYAYEVHVEKEEYTLMASIKMR
jgi:subtilisin family serine protease